MSELDDEQAERAAKPPAKKLRLRHDGFTPKKQRKFLKILRKTGCVRDACRGVGISSTSAYRVRERLPAFARQWETSLSMASSSLEAIAWARGVEGVEEPVCYYGKFSHMAVKRSESILRLLMMGANPRKYGRMGGGRISREERERIRREAQDELRAGRPTDEQVREALVKRLEAFGNRLAAEKARGDPGLG